MPVQNAQSSSSQGWHGLIRLMAMIDVVSVAAMLWRDSRGTELLVVWLNLVAVATCLVYARSVATEAEQIPTPARTQVPVAEPLVTRRSPQTPQVSRMPEPPATLDDFPSELERTPRRRAS